MRHRTLTFTAALIAIFCAATAEGKQIRDATGRSVIVPDRIERVICSGAGCLRLLTYLQALDLVVAVDDAETRPDRFGARPYTLANPMLRTKPVFGQWRGADNPELILALPQRPDVIFKTHPTMGLEPNLLQTRTGIPVVAVGYGNLGDRRDELFAGLRLMAAVIGHEARAEAIIGRIMEAMDDLAARVAASGRKPPSVYLGGVAFRGPRGILSTEPNYPPFALLNVPHVAKAHAATQHEVTDIPKEMLLAWDPDIIFVDLATTQLGAGAGALAELRGDPLLRRLRAMRNGAVFGLLPYNLYAANFESILANGYFVGSILHPDVFADVDPRAKADELYSFFVGRPVLDALDREFGGLVFRRIPLEP